MARRSDTKSQEAQPTLACGVSQANDSTQANVVITQLAAGPDIELSAGDPGDDTSERYRYQWCVGAIHCVAMAIGKSKVEYVYCEHHEDILLKFIDGSYAGMQVKTRMEGRAPFKTLDEPIVSAFKRFVYLELKFKGQFRAFVLTTNCGFWAENETRENLEYVVEIARLQLSANKPLGKRQILADLLNALHSDQDGYEEAIEAVLSKLQLEKDMPSLSDAHSRLVKHLAEIPQLAKECTYDMLSDMANRLTDLVSRASSHALESASKDYHAIMSDPVSEAAKVIIEGKRIGPDLVLAIIDNPTPREVLLRSGNTSTLPLVPLNKLELKMDAGGITIENIHNAQDLRFAAESYGLETLAMWGEPRALERWEHVRTIVRNQCQEAHDEVELENSQFGKAMLTKVRERLQSIYRAEKQELYGYRYEHLLGIASILTDECKVWWSKPFTMEFS